ncbi:type VI secretion system protein TssL, long form [Shewanella waksmanii]|uniref:type VI secretion system protein TssL, long form n=1 Tax=Shewanella waksmanii TaxID=213783 RepID=UPI0037366AAD
MNDKTVVKPRPGMRLAPEQAPMPTEADSQKTQVQHWPTAPRANQSVLGVSQNIMVDQAGTLLSIGIQIRNSNHHDDVTSLRVQCLELIKNYEQNLRNSHLAAEDIESARYCLCCFLDETVLNTTWGGESVWASESLLSTFHKETLGGEYFFTLMQDCLQQPQQKHQLLELMYLCITLGFAGKMRLEPQGEQQLEQLRDRAFQALQAVKGDRHKALSPNWRDKVVQDVAFVQPFPIWVIGALFAVLTLFIYMGFSYSINQYSSNVYKSLVALVPWQPTNNHDAQSLSRDEALVLQQLLQTEIAKQLLEVEQLSDRTRIRIGAGVLFSSGSTQPRSDFEAILAKIARTLESTSGKILITGHTDDDPIFTSKYPSNWHLSLARATAIGNFLANNASLSGRLWPEGRGESEPRVENNSEHNRALNRRIEIDLLF